jgi:hypothetical protein
MERGWFGPKSVGWGARPTSWRGWVVIAAFALVVCAIGLLRLPMPVRVLASAAAVVCVFLIIRVTYRASSKP